MRAPRAAIGWGLLLLLASLHWHVWMRQHASIHPHIILNMLPGMALILGGLASAGVRLAMDDARPAGMIRWLGLPLAAALTVAFASHLQYAAALNRLLPINRDMHAELNARARADQWWTDLGDALERRYGNVRRVVLYHWGPRQANRMGLPHQYVEGGQMPQLFGGEPTGVIADMPGVPPDGPSGGADLLMVEHPRRAKTPRVILEEGFDRFGFPEIDQGPESTTLFFSNRRWAGAPDAIPTDIRFTGGLRIDAVRLTESVTGDAFVLCMLVRGPNGAAFLPERHGVRAIDEQAADNDAETDGGLGGDGASQDAADATSTDEDGESIFDDAPEQAILPTRRPPDSIFALVRTFDADGQRTGVYSPMLASQALFRNRAMVWMVIDKHRLPRGGSLRIALTPLRREGRIDIRSAPTLGPGMSLDRDAGEIVWEVVRP
ncbi:MAG: hypothetical protein R3B68_03590 [Phycisphaerales bacterium]